MDAYLLEQKVSHSSFQKIVPEEGGTPMKFKAFIDNLAEKQDGEKLRLGTIVHQIVLEPEKYQVATIEFPTETIKTLVDTVYEANLISLDNTGLAETELKDYEKEIITCAKNMNYGQSWKEDTLVKKVLDGGNDYYEFLKRSKGKLIVDSDTFAQATSCKAAVNSNEDATHLLVSSGNFDGYNELEVFWTDTTGVQPIDCKAKLDRLIINEKQKKFYIVDLKTTSKSISLFRRSFEAFKYYRQLSFYKRAAHEWLKQQGKDDYGFAGAFIITVESFGHNECMVFPVSMKYIHAGGAEIVKVLKRISWHYQNTNWINSMEHVQNDMKTPLEPSEYFIEAHGIK